MRIQLYESANRLALNGKPLITRCDMSDKVFIHAFVHGLVSKFLDALTITSHRSQKLWNS